MSKSIPSSIIRPRAIPSKPSVVGSSGAHFAYGASTFPFRPIWAEYEEVFLRFLTDIDYFSATLDSDVKDQRPKTIIVFGQGQQPEA